MYLIKENLPQTFLWYHFYIRPETESLIELSVRKEWPEVISLVKNKLLLMR
jgi:hypothetical protein